MYDAGIGRFHTIDPLAEKYNLQSPFVYAANNPIRYNDFMGLGAEDQVDKKDKSHEITEAEVNKIVESLPENFTAGDMLNAVVKALNQNENATIKGSTIKSFSEKKAKAQLSKLDPENPDDKDKIDAINKGLASSDEVFNQIDRVDKTGNEVTVVPTGEEIVIDAKITVRIKKDNKITIKNASSKGVTLSVKGIKIGPTKLRSVTITPTTYTVDLGRFIPNIKGDF
jgi:hypothetical protein